MGNTSLAYRGAASWDIVPVGGRSVAVGVEAAEVDLLVYVSLSR